MSLSTLTLHPAALVLDLLVVLTVVFFAWRGWKKGLILTLFSLVAVFVALLGANFLAAHFEPAAADYLAPRFETMLTDQFTQELEREQESRPETSFEELPVSNLVMDFLRNVGLFESLAEDFSASVKDTAQKSIESAAALIAVTLAKLVAKTLLFIFFFAGILIVWFIISHLLDLVFKLPVLDTLNSTGGMVCGLIKALLVIWIAVLLFQLKSNLITNETLHSSFVLRFFVAYNPIFYFISMS